MSTHEIMVYVCFGGWAVSVFLVVILSAVNPISYYKEKMEIHKRPRDILMIVSIMFWALIFVFRSMY